jgi:hypothetical protein
MALTTLAQVRQVPGLNNVVKYTDAWLSSLILAADQTIKDWCKQNLELQAYTEYHSGNEQPGLVLVQYPLWNGVTQIAAGSNGVELPVSTINVVSTRAPDGSNAFDPGGRSSGQSPVIAVQTSTLNTWTAVSYTGITATSFTGCTGGTGTLSSQGGLNGISQPVAWIDFQGQWDQRPLSSTSDVGPFGPKTIQVLGINYAVNQNRSGVSGKSKQGLLTRIGGYGVGGWLGSYPYQLGQIGKLSSYRLPCWPRGTGNIKVQYSAGYETIPADLSFAATTLVSRMVRSQPNGFLLSSESLGAYSYSILANGNDPEISDIRSILSRYKEVSW